jgi:GrpB-like predicted nucleotidyltransferase (UPF0157 family)
MDRPVVIAEYDPAWPEIFTQESFCIQSFVSSWMPELLHIGSTSVPGLRAKPIIDMLGGLNSLEEAVHLIEPLTGLGYTYVPDYEDVLPERRFFNKHEKSNHNTGFHLHVVEIGSLFWRRHLAFRDYLRTHPEAANEYGQLKTRLAAECGTDREKYTDSKTEFIQRIERLAGVSE